MASIPPVNAAAGAVLSWVSFACNVSLHFTQVPLMLAMLRDGDPASRSRYSHWPSVFQAAATAQWLGYANTVLPSLPLVINNAIGLAVSLAYVACFLVALPTAREKARVAAWWLAVVAFAVVVYAALFAPSPRPSSALWAVSITTIVTISLWASPLVALREAARELDVKRVPVPLTIVMLLTTTLWLVTGFLVGDMALVVCSFFGAALSALQLVVLCWIRLQPQPRKEIAAADELDTTAVAERAAVTELEVISVAEKAQPTAAREAGPVE
jgi:hypothetical protein